MNKIVKVLDGQSIWDIAVQEYGSVEGVKQLIIDNPQIGFESNVATNTLLKITQEPMNRVVYNYYITENIKPATAVNEAYNPSDWILADGTWNDNGFWIDNALWID